jgi:formylglycine-generating enzyme required for sulfatase activity
LGFRLPTEREWLFSSRANDERDFPWGRLLDSEDENERAKGDRLKRFLTQSLETTRDVWTSVENDFGVYGMLGNVREWADTLRGFEKPADDGDCLCQVMGATSALGHETFRFDYEGIPLSPRNTNPDVGFRWARNVSPVLKQTIEEMQREHTP